MGLGKLLFNLLLKIRTGAQKAGGSLLSKSIDPETGKLKWLSVVAWRRLRIAFLVAFFGVVFISQIFTRSANWNHSFDDLNKEIRLDGGTHARAASGPLLFDNDPLSELSGQTRDRPLDSNSDLNGATSGVASANLTNPQDSAGPIPTESECFSAIEKAKAGSELNLSDRDKINSCITNNVVPVTEADKRLLRTLAAGDLTPAERQAILTTMKGAGNERQKKLSDVISASTDPDRQLILKDGVNRELSTEGVSIDGGEVRGLSKTMAGKPADYGQAIDGSSKILDGAKPSDGERSNLIDAIRALKGGDDAALDNPKLSTDKEKAVTDLVGDVQDRDTKIQELRRQLAEAQADARVAADRIAKGEALSADEQAALDKMSNLRKQLSALETLQEKRQRSLIELTAHLQQTVASAEVSIQKTIPSGVFEGYADYKPLECKDVKPLVRIGKRRSKDVKVASDSNGGKRGVNLSAKQAFNVYRKVDDGGKMELDGKRIDISQYTQGNVNISELFIGKDSGPQAIILSPQTKIAAMLDSQIMVAGGGSAQSVRVKIVQDVFDAKTNQLVIPKNSVAIGRTNDFDETTGVMDLQLDKVSVGAGKTVTINMRVGSGDGSMGLKGEIRDTRGRFILGAIITSFTAGALDFFTQNTIAQYQKSAVASTALQGAGFSAGADAANRVANLFSNDLQNAKKIFVVPRGVPIVLFPEQ